MSLTHHLYIFSLSIIFLFGGCVNKKSTDKDCNDWFKKTLNIVESVPVHQRYQETLKQIANGCYSVPTHLREAARKSLSLKGPDAKRTLMRAADSYVSGECMVNDPTTTASKLIHICFEERWPNGDFCAMLPHVDAATYLYSRALKIEWEKTGDYEKHGKKLIANFLISNAGLRETELSGHNSKDK
jgi:hypothetical protein